MRGWIPNSLKDHPGLGLALKLGDTIGCPGNGRGFVVALKRSLACIDAFSAVRELNNLKVYRDTLASFTDSMLACVDLPSHVRAIPDIKSERPAYSLWLIDPAKQHAPADAKRVDQLLGLLLLSHISSGRQLVDSRAGSCIKIVKAGNRQLAWGKPWLEFVQAFSLTGDFLGEESAQSSHPPLRELAEFLEVASRSPISAPVPGNAQDKRLPPSDSAPSAIDEKGAVKAEDHASKSKPEKDLRKGSLVAWQFARATKASAAQLAGLVDWDLLSPRELRETTVRLANYLRNPPCDEFIWAVLAVISLICGLPPRLVLSLPLADNGDVWIDVEAGCICWCQTPLTGSRSVSPAICEAGHRPANYFRVPLPRSVAAFLRSIITSYSGELRQHLFANVPDDQILAAYGQVLRSDPEADFDSARKPFSARFAYSFGAVVFHVTRNQILAGLVAQDFRHLAPSEIDYLCVSEKHIENAIRKTFRFLCFDDPVPLTQPGFVGSPLCPTPASVKAAMTALCDASSTSVDMVTPRTTWSSFVEWFNKKVVADAATLVLLSAHRGVMLHRWTCAALYASSEALLAHDKETSVSTVRLLPKTWPMQQLLEAHRRDLMSAAKRLERICPATAARIERIARLQEPSAPAFFFLKVSKSSRRRIKLRPVQSKHVGAVLAQFGLARNAGRHYALSQLVARNVPAPLIRVISGHSRASSQPFHSAAGIAPLQAVSKLRPALEEVQKYFTQSPWPSFRAQSVPHQVMTIRPRHVSKFLDTSVEAFRRRDERLLGRRVEPFHLQSLTYYAFANHVRAQLLAGAKGLSPWAAVLVALCMIDGIASVQQLESAWSAVARKALYPIGKTCLVVYSTATGRLVAMPMQPVTTICIAAALHDESIAYSEAVAETAAWLTRLAPEVKWSEDPAILVGEICGVVDSAATLELPPWIRTAQCSTLDTAAISVESIARIIFGRPALWMGTLPRARRRKVSNNRSTNSIDHVCKEILNPAGDIQNRLGEEAARRTWLREQLEAWREKAPMPTPGADGLATYLDAERINDGWLGRRLEMSSLATYVSTYRVALELVEHEHPLEYDEEQWREALHITIDRQEGKELERRRTIFRRFARFWLARGASVPEDVIGFTPGEQTDSPPNRASSIFLSRRQTNDFREYVAGEFEAGSLLHAKAMRYVDLAIALPLRAGEFGPIRLADFNEESNTLAITTSGYSHLKSSPARRAQPLDDCLSDDLTALRDRIQDASPESFQFFLSPTPGQEWAELEAIVATIADGLVLVTGEAGVRQHSLRGTAECYLVCPQFDEIVRALLKNRVFNGRLAASVFDEWWCVSRASSIAGHHPLSAIQFYLSVWPVLAYNHRRHLYSKWRPGAGFERLIREMTADNLRQLVSRESREPTAQQDIWSLLLGRISLAGEDLAALLMPPCELSVKKVGATDPDTQQNSMIGAKVCFVACRMASLTFNAAVDVSGISVREGESLESLLSFSLMPKVNPSVSVHSALIGQEGAALANAFAHCDDLAKLQAIRQSVDAAKRAQPTPLNELIVAAKQLCALLPPHLTVSILPEHDHPMRELQLAATNLQRDVVVKPASKRLTERYRFQIVPRDPHKRGARSQGDATALFRLILDARILLFISERESVND